MPFTCSAALLSRSGAQLAQLDRLVQQTSVTLDKGYWSCAITFASDATPLLYDLLNANSAAQQLALNDEDREPTAIRVNIQPKSSFQQQQQQQQQQQHSQLPHEIQLSFAPAFYVSTKSVELSLGKKLRHHQQQQQQQSNHQHQPHVIVSVRATRRLHAHLSLSSNCGPLISIKAIAPGVAHPTTLHFEISLSNDYAATKFDLNKFVQLVQEQRGNLYIQVSCSLTQQVERIPLRLTLSPSEAVINLLDDTPRSQHQQHYQQQRQAYTLAESSWVLDYTLSQITSFLLLVSLGLVAILCLIRFRQPSQQAAEQIALNASAAAAAAAVAANAYRNLPGSGVKEHSSFNPYRYFSNSPNAMMSGGGGGVTGADLNGSVADQLRYRGNTTTISPTKRFSPIGSAQQLQRTSMLNTSGGGGGGGLGRMLFNSDERYHNQTLSQAETNGIRLFSTEPLNGTALNYQQQKQQHQSPYGGGQRNLHVINAYENNDYDSLQ